MPISSVTKNNNCVTLNKKYREKRAELKAKINARRTNRDIPMRDQISLMFELDALPKNSAKVRIRNRCSITGRGNAVYRYFGICGFQIREKAMKGMLPGVQHASW
jgi:small subunit ribosomal protein S14